MLRLNAGQVFKSVFHNFRRALQNQLPRIVFTLILAGSILSPAPVLPARAQAGAPVPISPANNTLITPSQNNPLAMPEFSWSPVSGATLYNLQVSTNIGFTTINFEISTPLTTYIPSNGSIFADGNWYWRVRVYLPEIGPYSTQTMLFTKRWADAAHKPALIAPLDNASLDFFSFPVFSWEPIDGAASYYLQIDSNQYGFNPPLYIYRTIDTVIQPELKLTNANYFWRVVPLDPYDHNGTPSDVRAFQMSYGTGTFTSEIPKPLSPPNSSQPVFTPTFQWEAVRGAQYYVLEYSTNSSFQGATVIQSFNTSYTPVVPLANDVNYYWHVRAYSGNSISNWSATQSFKKNWNIQPVLLTPTNNYIHVRFPFFSWSPVPGASYYVIETAYDVSFSYIFNTATSSNTFYTPEYYYGGCDVIPGSCVRYWRVTPYDSAGQKGKTSETFSYESYQEHSSPNQVYPFYYYTPSTIFNTLTREDRTAPLPIFIWQRLTTPYPVGGTMSHAYRIEVSTDPIFMTPPEWRFDTENTSAVPTSLNNFTPVAGVDYYWRVIQLTDLGGTVILPWSQVWRVRFDLSRGLSPTSSPNPPTLLRPAHAAEIVETTPLFEWVPVQDATSYLIEISSDPEFDAGYTIISESVPYSAYTPQTSLAQRLLGELNFGSYYWRVQAYIGGIPATGGWSEIHRFQVASQSEWAVSRSILPPENDRNALEIASDADDVADDYELTKLYASQDRNYWYFRFNYYGTTPMTYGLYLDLDHKDGSGGSTDARGYENVTTLPAHYPEFAIYLLKQNGGTFSQTQVVIYPWNKSLQTWGTPFTLDSITPVGEVSLFHENNQVEIRIPNTAIGGAENTGSYALALFSIANLTSSLPQDSVPTSPEVPGSGVLSRFASVSQRMNLVYPPNSAAGDPTTFPSIPPTFFDFPTGHNYGSSVTDPWAGAEMEIYRDADYTQFVTEFVLTSSGAYYASSVHAWPYDLLGDNTYYWRMKPRYLDISGVYWGAWTQGSHLDDPLDPRYHFIRKGFVPQNLQESTTFATPTFSWEPVEGASWYELQVDNDSNFGSMEITVQSAQTSYTHSSTLRNGTYYWRVRVIRWNTVYGEWSEVKSFTQTLPKPTNLSPDDPYGTNPFTNTPTLCWDPIVEASNNIPVLAAFKYYVQVSKNPNIPPNELYDQATTEQNCWTPIKGYDDGTYYWHVSMLDGTGLLGDFSNTARFVKQYPITTLIYPANGDTVPAAPIFEWSPVDGASIYHIEISTKADFSVIYDYADTCNVRFYPLKLYEPNKQYYWRVAYLDRDAHWGPYTNATVIIGASQYIYLPLISKP